MFESAWEKSNRYSERDITKQRSKHLESIFVLRSELAPRIKMPLSTVCFIAVLASTFSGVLCVPQVPSQASNTPDDQDSSTSVSAGNDDSSITPDSMAYLLGTSFPDKSNVVALQPNGGILQRWIQTLIYR